MRYILEKEKGYKLLLKRRRSKLLSKDEVTLRKLMDRLHFQI